jgi:DNA excision repair protein ERCC-4
MTKIPVIIDTREQKSWDFAQYEDFEIYRQGLPSGDYSILGMEERVAIERKSLGDAVQTLIQGWLRFRKELCRLSGYDMALIVIEANLSDIIEHRYESEASPESVLARISEIMIDHNIPVFLAGDHESAGRIAARFLRMAWKRWK